MLSNGQDSKASNEFKDKLNKLNADNKGFNVDDVIDTIKTAIVEVIELEIVTWVSEPSTHQDNPNPNESEVPQPGNRMCTTINLIDGNIKNEIGSQFIGTGPYTELLEFHLSQVKEGREIIQKNLESVHKLYEILMEMLRSRKTSQQSNIR